MKTLLRLNCFVFLIGVYAERVHPNFIVYSCFSVIAGFGSENQILEALHRYLDRPYYIQKTLYHLFKMTTGNYEPAIDITVPRIDIIKVRN